MAHSKLHTSTISSNKTWLTFWIKMDKSLQKSKSKTEVILTISTTVNSRKIWLMIREDRALILKIRKWYSWIISFRLFTTIITRAWWTRWSDLLNWTTIWDSSVVCHLKLGLIREDSQLGVIPNTLPATCLQLRKSRRCQETRLRDFWTTVMNSSSINLITYK
jgi:hypothetical protein